MRVKPLPVGSTVRLVRILVRDPHKGTQLLVDGTVEDRERVDTPPARCPAGWLYKVRTGDGTVLYPYHEELRALPYEAGLRVRVATAIQTDAGDLEGESGTVASGFHMEAYAAGWFGVCGLVYDVRFDNGQRRPVLHEEMEPER